MTTICIYRVTIVLDCGTASTSTITDRECADIFFRIACNNDATLYAVIMELTAESEQCEIVNEYHRDYDLAAAPATGN